MLSGIVSTTVCGGGENVFYGIAFRQNDLPRVNPFMRLGTGQNQELIS
jgi:hypothetical protein